MSHETLMILSVISGVVFVVGIFTIAGIFQMIGLGELTILGVVFAIIGFVGIMITTTIMTDQYQAQANINQDPKVGIVHIKGLEDMTKKCDGSTLVYAGNETSNVVPNSPECK